MNENVRDEIIAQANAWMEAVRRRDMPALERILGEEYVLISGKIGRMERAVWLANASGSYAVCQFSYDNVRVRDYGDVATMDSRYSQQAAFNGGDMSLTYFVTDTWVKRDGRWQVVLRHTSPIEGVTT